MKRATSDGREDGISVGEAENGSYEDFHLGRKEYLGAALYHGYNRLGVTYKGMVMEEKGGVGVVDYLEDLYLGV